MLAFLRPLNDNLVYEQSAVVPYRRGNDGLEVLLITSLRRGRWIVPKGLVEEPLSPAESAVAEAYEEAGVKGRVGEEPVGEYSYRKWGGVCRVQVFLLEVDDILDSWPEAGMRRREWMAIDEAATVAQPKGLRSILRGLAESMT